MKSLRLLIGLVMLILLPHCEFLDEVAKRFNVLMVQFDFAGVELKPVIPDALQLFIETAGLVKARSGEQLPIPIPSFDPNSYIAQTGIDVIAKIPATNPNDNEAVFDGADFLLRVQDTSRTAPADTAAFAPFTLDSGATDTLEVPFKIRMDNPVFSQAVLNAIVAGDEIPYKVGADLFFNLVTPSLNGTVDTLGSQTVPLDLVSDNIATRPSQSMIDLMIQAIGLFF